MDKDKIIQSLLKLLQKNNTEIINLNVQIDDLYYSNLNVIEDFEADQLEHYFLGSKAFYLNEPISTFCHAFSLKS